MVIVESNNQFDAFLSEFSVSDSIIVPIFTDNSLHSLNNKLSLLYIHTLHPEKDFILPFDHSEALNLDIQLLSKLKESERIKYTLRKKELSHTVPLKNVIDITLIHYLQNNSDLEIGSSDIIKFFQHKYY
ncbi:hypothetical protein LCGC14_2926680, partial [marine sediment metagenome]